MYSRCLAVVVGLALSFGATGARSQPAPTNPIRSNPVPPAPSRPHSNPSATTATQSQPEPGYLGVLADHANEQGRGIRILAVMEGSPAQAAGLEPRAGCG